MVVMSSIQPTPDILEAFRNQRLQWVIILGELIDNAFDADAKQVIISFQKGSLTIQDDGTGCKNLLLLLTPGMREHKATTQLGRYGIGAKDAFVSAGDWVRIESTYEGIARTVFCDWKALQRSGKWDIESPQEFPGERSGTKIVIKQLRNSDNLQKKRVTSLLEKLSTQYTPAIRSGLQIIFNGAPIAEQPLPALEHQQTVDLDVGGKKARVTIGLVPEGQTVKESGLTISFGYRVILRNQRIGLGEQPTPGLVGRVELGEGWQLTKNKENITDNLEPLGRLINSHFHAVISRAAKRARIVQFENVADEINKLLQELEEEKSPRQRKAKRDPAENLGPVLPKNTDKRHKRAARSQPGETFDEFIGRSNGLKIAFDNLGSDGPSARYSGGIIYLNSDIPAIASAPENEHSIRCHAIHTIAAYWVTTRQRQLSLEGWDECTDFELTAKIAGHLLAKIGTDRQQITIAG